MTCKCAGTTCSRSVTSSPTGCNAPPRQAQVLLGTLITTSSRGRLRERNTIDLARHPARQALSPAGRCNNALAFCDLLLELLQPQAEAYRDYPPGAIDLKTPSRR